MRRYYVCFLSKPGPKTKNRPFDILFPAGGKVRQFDTIEQAKPMLNSFRQGTAFSYQRDIGTWEIVDLWETAKNPMLIVVEV